MKVEYNCPECKDFSMNIEERREVFNYYGSHIGYVLYKETEREDLVCEKCGSYLVRKEK